MFYFFKERIIQNSQRSSQESRRSDCSVPDQICVPMSFKFSLSQTIQMTQSLSISDHDDQQQYQQLDSTPRLQYPTHNIDPLSEFSTPFLASMAFPTLFPRGVGDPWTLSRHSDSTTQLMKFRHLLRYCEVHNEKITMKFTITMKP